MQGRVFSCGHTRKISEIRRAASGKGRWLPCEGKTGTKVAGLANLLLQNANHAHHFHPNFVFKKSDMPHT